MSEMENIRVQSEATSGNIPADTVTIDTVLFGRVICSLILSGTNKYKIKRIL
jgi:hypothetical protein